jgi:predicted dehydrogenase
MYRVGVIGAGWVAGEHFRAYQNNPETEVVAVAVRREETARAHMEGLGFSCDIYTDVATMLKTAQLDIVSICTPPSMHPEHSIAAAEAGCHVVLEKPVALDLVDLRRIDAAVNAAGVKTVVGFVLRWNPLFEIITSLLDQEAIGRIFYGEVNYNHGIGPWYGQYAWNRTKKDGGSSLLSAGIHAVDALRWFVRKEVVEVTAYSTNSDNTDVYTDGYEYDPTIVTILKFADGSIGKASSSIECIQPYTFPIVLQGSAGTIMNNKVYSKKLMPGQTDFAEVPTILPDSGDVTEHPFLGEINHFVECIKSDTESHCNLTDAIKTHEICYAAQMSADEGRPVKLPLS